jgi:hypothetical protein
MLTSKFNLTELPGRDSQAGTPYLDFYYVYCTSAPSFGIAADRFFPTSSSWIDTRP